MELRVLVKLGEKEPVNTHLHHIDTSKIVRYGQTEDAKVCFIEIPGIRPIFVDYNLKALKEVLK